MKLSELLSAIPKHLGHVERDRPDLDPTIRSIEIDSRAVRPGALFVALRGVNHDGHDYLPDALTRGAVALLVESAPPGFHAGEAPLCHVGDTRRALAPISTAFFGEPSDDLELVGITGTNGKTSTTYLVESILNQAGHSVGVMGTVEIRYGGERLRSINTTPESLELQRCLRAMHNAGVRTVAMEISSHGLALGRVAGCKFGVAAFTNLSQDHLDFHGDMDAYLESKLELFRSYLAEGASAVINVDDARAEAFCEAADAVGARVIRASRDPEADAEVRLGHTEGSIQGSRGQLFFPDGAVEFHLPLLGDFNLENLIVAAGIGLALDLAPEVIAAGIASCPQVPGRMEKIDGATAAEPTVIVDYAHTPDAIEKLLQSLVPLTNGRLITVFGCGGDRDRSKRPLMAQSVAHHSDRIIATSDNPRTEDPLTILQDIEVGLAGLERTTVENLAQEAAGYAMLPDRRTAIQLAIAMARSEDTVVIAGKGHEDYQIIGRERLPFDDCHEARHALELRAAKLRGGAR